MSDPVMITIVPDPDRFNSVARQLLDIVGPGREAEVAVVTLPHRGFRVPEDVAVEFARRTAPQPSKPLVEAEEPAVAPEPVAVEPPRPRRRGSKRGEGQ